MVKTRQVRLPVSMINDIMKLKRKIERESYERYGKRKPCTFVKAASEYHRQRNNNFFGGRLI